MRKANTPISRLREEGDNGKENVVALRKREKNKNQCAGSAATGTGRKKGERSRIYLWRGGNSPSKKEEELEGNAMSWGR